MMKRSPARLSTVAAVAFAVDLALPAHGEESSPTMPSDGLTRDSLAEPTAPQHVATTRSAAASTARKHRRQAQIDPKDFVAIHHSHRHHRIARHHRASAKKQEQVADSKPASPRNPLESFVFWWNGLVVRNFHTRNGTVLLDKIGAKS